MLNQADLKVIQTVFGKTADELSGAISSEQEVSLGLRLNGRVISQEDEDKLKKTLTDAGIEIGYKKIAKEASLDLNSGEKDAKIILDKITSGLESKFESKYKNLQPGEVEKELEKKLNDSEAKYSKLYETHENTLQLVDEKENAYNVLKGEIKTKNRNSIIMKAFPEKMKMDKSDALLIFTNTYEFDEVDDNIILKRDGKTVTNAVGEPEKIENIVPSFAEEKKWIKGAGMNGSDRNHNGSGLPKGMTDDQAMVYMAEKGIDSMTPKGGEMFIQLTSTE